MNDSFNSPIAQAFWQACVTELEALKPGNVSIYSDGHGMCVSDFLHSAKSVADLIAQPDASVGTRILHSIQATQQAVGCNTNLGIVLLCAPLACAAQEIFSTNSRINLQQALQQVLHALSRADAEHVFQAIRLAQPAGLGDSERHDVRQAAQATLLDIMAVAEQRDRIAFQYCHGFQDIFDTGLPALRQALKKGHSLQWATVRVYLNFLASFPDSHIMRKHGVKIAEQVYRQAHAILALYNAQADPQALEETLLVIDQQLKNANINPGTSADLTVATLFTGQLQELIATNFTASPLRAAFNTREHARADSGMLSLVF